MSLSYHFVYKIDESCFFGDRIFKMRKFKMAMSIDKSRGNNSLINLHLITCFFLIHYINYFSGIIRYKHIISWKQRVPIKYTIGLKFSITHVKRIRLILYTIIKDTG